MYILIFIVFPGFLIYLYLLLFMIGNAYSSAFVVICIPGKQSLEPIHTQRVAILWIKARLCDGRQCVELSTQVVFHTLNISASFTRHVRLESSFCNGKVLKEKKSS